MRPILVLAAVLPLAAFAQEQADFPRQVDLFVAGQTVLKIPHLLKVAVGDAEIADIRTIGSELLVIGSAPGQTTLRVWLEGAPAWIDVKVVVTRTLLVKPVTQTEVVLKIGESKTLDAPQLARVAIGDTDIADIATPTDSALTLRGVAEGATTLIWWAGSARHEVLVRVTK